MTRRLRSVAVLLLALALAWSAAPPGATAPSVTTVGFDVVPAGFCNAGFTFVQSDSSTGAHRVPARGVLTGFRAVFDNNAPDAVTFKTFRSVGGGNYRVLAAAPAVLAQAGSGISADIRMPVEAGDVLGLSIGSLGGNCVRAEVFYTLDDAVPYATGTPGPGGTFTPTATLNGYRMGLTARWEPDADGDRFGDRTQDSCTTDPTTQGACASSAPRTRITSAAVRRGRLQLRFSAGERATFRCAVDSPAFRPCRSPLARRLKPGRHLVAVVATDRYGNVDATPALRTVRLPRRN